MTGGLEAALSELGMRGVAPMAPAPGMDSAAVAGSLRSMPDPIGGRAPSWQETANPGVAPMAPTDRENQVRSNIEGLAPPSYDGQAPRLRDITSSVEEADLAPVEGIPGWQKAIWAISEAARGMNAGMGGPAYQPSAGPAQIMAARRENRIAEVERARASEDAEVDRRDTRAARQADIALKMAQADKAARDPGAGRDPRLQYRGDPDQQFAVTFDPATGGATYAPNPNYQKKPPKIEGGVAWTSDEYGTEYANTIAVDENGQPTLVPIRGADGKPATRRLKPERPNEASVGELNRADTLGAEDYARSPEGQKKRGYIESVAEYRALQAIDPELGPANVDERIQKLTAAAQEPPPAEAAFDETAKLAWKQRVKAAETTLTRIQNARDNARKAAAAEFEDFARSKGRRGPSGRVGVFAGESGYSE